jgi:hypothetical protein
MLGEGHPKEDYHIASNDPLVFVVSDGVTLNFERLIETDRKYPNPSPAGIVAEIFCKAVIAKGSEKFSDISSKCAEDIFRYANTEVGKYNQKVGKSDISGNPTEYYSATGAFTIVKDRRAYWVSICDAFVAHFSSNMRMKFMSTGYCSPYAVINGEERMADHIENGVFDLEKGDRVFVFTDGFEYYVKDQDFLSLFIEWDDTLEKRIVDFSRKKNELNSDKYGHERSLIAVCIG